jgi:hypothetical protein
MTADKTKSIAKRPQARRRKFYEIGPDYRVGAGRDSGWRMIASFRGMGTISLILPIRRGL